MKNDIVIETMNISFETSGTINQVIRLFDPMSQNEFISKVKSGNIVTSVGHNMQNGYVYEITNEGKFLKIGEVVGQESLDDMEFSGFNLDDVFEPEEIETF
jgi:hypothetical protein